MLTIECCAFESWSQCCGKLALAVFFVTAQGHFCEILCNRMYRNECNPSQSEWAEAFCSLFAFCVLDIFLVMKCWIWLDNLRLTAGPYHQWCWVTHTTLFKKKISEMGFEFLLQPPVSRAISWKQNTDIFSHCNVVKQLPICTWSSHEE